MRTWPVSVITAGAIVVLCLATGPRNRALAQVSDQSSDVDETHDALQVATMSSLLVTATLGTLIAINQPTLFSEGRCRTGDPIFGSYGCRGLSVLHGLTAVASLVLYTATTTLEVSEYDWPGQHDHGSGYEVASWIHLGGMAVLPIAGLVAVVPDVIGLTGQGKQDFQKVLRTLHLMLGYTTVGTYTATAIIDLD